MVEHQLKEGNIIPLAILQLPLPCLLAFLSYPECLKALGELVEGTKISIALDEAVYTKFINSVRNQKTSQQDPQIFTGLAQDLQQRWAQQSRKKRLADINKCRIHLQTENYPKQFKR